MSMLTQISIGGICFELQDIKPVAFPSQDVSHSAPTSYILLKVTRSIALLLDFTLTVL
jgi:hypothetical protein